MSEPSVATSSTPVGELWCAVDASLRVGVVGAGVLGKCWSASAVATTALTFACFDAAAWAARAWVV